ncbi:MAG: hypothetical protein PHD51_01970 [Patescibacteria group bacterium]|nr:hypothetical protein [Patescibacteria group bacterium]MDD5490373.1 hypothetical protein [Patescibacteria group bacterium]
MLEHLFGSKARVKLLRLFLNNPDKPFFVRELSRYLKLQINSIRRELQNLETIGIIMVDRGAAEESAPGKGKGKKGGKIKKSRASQKKFFKADRSFILYKDLKNLLVKAQVLLENDFIKKLKKFGSLSYLALSGVFVGQDNSSTDILIVGKMDRRKLKRLVRTFEKELGMELRVTLMAVKEFEYRRNITDRFLYGILDGKKIVLVDKWGK